MNTVKFFHSFVCTDCWSVHSVCALVCLSNGHMSPCSCLSNKLLRIFLRIYDDPFHTYAHIHKKIIRRNFFIFFHSLFPDDRCFAYMFLHVRVHAVYRQNKDHQQGEGERRKEDPNFRLPSIDIYIRIVGMRTHSSTFSMRFSTLRFLFLCYAATIVSNDILYELVHTFLSLPLNTQVTFL